MDTATLRRALDEALPDEHVINDVRDVFIQEPGGETCDVEVDGEIIRVPKDAEVCMVGKAFYKEYFKVPFGTYKAQVAIGGVVNQEFGILTARYCFATLYYNQQREMITIDFHSAMR